MCPSDWLESCKLSLEAGADIIVIEARETGTAGIVDKDGNIKMETIDLLISEIGKEKLLFEAPTKDIQSFLINKYGSSINLGNISIQNILPLQALRQNLRSDTLTFQSIDK
jgi:phosphosulfolactate synthase